MRIKNDKNLSTEEKFEKLHLYILNFMSDEALSPYEEIIKKVYGDCLSFITTPAKLFLLSGYYDAAIRKKTSSSIIDCSTITILFTKVVETEIENKIWLPYKRFFLQSAYFKQSFSQDLEDKDLNRFMRFLIDQDNKIKTPELGTTKYFLNTILNSKKRAQWSLVIKSFNDFCSTLNESSQQFLKDELPAILSEITTVYRNGSAHTKPLKLETALEYISKLEAGILKKILNIHP
ncbi:MAG TPA: hypothetical protein PKM18_08465 [bacterium]|nr:hypothetical protein [bacterium]